MLCTAIPAWAQKLTLTIDRTIVGVGESVNLTLTLSGSTGGDEPSLPQLQNLQVVSGPYTSTSYEFINGRSSSSISYIYRLRALRQGREQIGPIQVTMGGKTVISNQIVVNIGANPSKSQSQSGESNETPDVFIRVAPDKTDVYQGDQITLTYRIYFCTQITQPEIQQLPTASGFWVEELTVSPNQALTDEVVNGRAYKVGILRKVALFPTTTGDLTVEPLVINTKVQRDIRRRSRDPLDIFNDPFFSLGRQLEPMEVSSPSVTLHVRALPSASAPSGFNGAVGAYKIVASLDKTNAMTNDAVTLSVQITGVGNIKTLPEPVMTFPPDLDHYDPKSSEQIRRDQQRINGTKRFDYVVIARAPGEQVIPPITYSFFDPGSDKYSTITTTPLRLIVQKGQGTVAKSGIPVATKRGVESIATDLAFIKTQSDGFAPVSSVPHRTVMFWFVAAMPWVAIGGIALATRRNGEKDPRRVYRKALKRAQEAIVHAGKNLKANNLDATSHQITASLHLMLSAVLEESVEALTEEEISARWNARGLDPLVMERVNDILREADLIRFASALADKQATRELVQKASAAVSDMSTARVKVAA
jgi:hypothetical protein